MNSRRSFLGHVATGLAGTLASPAAVLAAGARIRVGVIGAGERGIQLAREVQAAGGEVAAVADVYARRLVAARTFWPHAAASADYRELLASKDVDAVLVATPQHLHGGQVLAALEAGKHVYAERNLAFTVEEARLVREAARQAPRLVVQVGHQSCSSGHYDDVQRFLAEGRVGRITAIHAHMFRNTPRGKPQGVRPVYPDIAPGTLDWDAFLGGAPARDFDAARFANWRFYWDYSGGSVYENLSQQLAFWYKTLGLEIPRAVSMLGGVYLWQDGRETPDTMSVAMEHGEGLLFSWDCGFGNSQLGASEEVLGTDGTISRGQQVRYIPQKVNRPGDVESLGQARTRPNAHMQDFLECIATGKPPSLPVEIGYRVAVACRKADRKLPARGAGCMGTRSGRKSSRSIFGRLA